MKRYVIILLLVTGSVGIGIGQEKTEQKLDRPLAAVHVISGTANVGFGVSKANFTNNSTSWKHPFGYAITGGVGFSYMIKNSIGIEADFSYELNYYVYKNQNVNLSLGYRAPYIDAKLKKILKPGAEDSFYIKAGWAYMFGGKGGISKSESDYSYSIAFESPNIFIGMFEVGFQKRSSKKNYMDFGLVYRHGFSDIISSNMIFIDQANPGSNEQATSITKGNYIGITYKYYAILKMWSKKQHTGKKANAKF